MRVDHRRPNVLVSQQFLNRTDVIASLKQVRGEQLPQCVRTAALRFLLL
jgi:hypothetical protein